MSPAGARRTVGQVLMAAVDRTPAWKWTSGLVAAVLTATLFWGGTLGMAEGHDTTRVACELGIDAPGVAGERGGDYVAIHWDPRAWPEEACDQSPPPSAHRLLLRAAMTLTFLAGLGPGLDLRVVAVICIALAAAAVAAFTAAVRGPGWVKAIAGLTVGVVLADGGVGSFFVSVYGEAVAVLALAALMAAWVWHPRRAGHRWLPPVAVLAAGTVLITSNWKLVALAPVMALGLMVRGSAGGATVGRLAARLACIGAAVGLVAVGFATLRTTPPELKAAEEYHAVFSTLLPASDDREATLRDLGLPPNLAVYPDQSYWETGAGDDPAFADFTRDFSYVDLAAYYLTHPARLLDLHRDMSDAAATVRDGAYGNFPADAGELPGSTKCRLCVLSNLAPYTSTVAWFVLPSFWVIAARMGLVLVRRARRAGDPGLRATGELLTLLAVMAAVQYASVALVSGVIDPIKGQVVNVTATAFMVAVMVPAGWGLHSLSVRLETAPGLLRRLGRRLAALLVVPPEVSSGEPAQGAPVWVLPRPALAPRPAAAAAAVALPVWASALRPVSCAYVVTVSLARPRPGGFPPPAVRSVRSHHLSRRRRIERDASRSRPLDGAGALGSAGRCRAPPRWHGGRGPPRARGGRGPPRSPPP